MPALAINFFFIAAISFMIVIATNPKIFTSIHIPLPDAGHLQTFKTTLISIMLEALPFIILGVLVSSLMQVFIPEKWIQKLTPRNPLLGILFACVLGVIFPVCECGMIPVVRRLIAKGMPLYIGTVFILAGPIINPVVFAATYMAFRTRPEMAYMRMGLAFGVAACVGLFIYYFVKKNAFRTSKSALHHVHSHEHGESVHHHTHDHTHDHSHQHHQSSKWYSLFEHACSEFFDMGKYLMFGSFITATIQTFVSRGDLTQIGHGMLSSHLFMMGFAYVLSLCSTSDAFVATSFLSTFSAGSLLTFLVFGPMLDLKSTLMLLSAFKTRFVVILFLLIVILVPAGAFALESLFIH
ncbi:permease [Paenibacillus hamazuiensis]|uniref:permease n=1 Tax=Paenibacillus hamazuiensis TaxID=2936508 RepID=UPI00200FA2FD|nr:permease [Paenibacillus hamazuiensis]